MSEIEEMEQEIRKQLADDFARFAAFYLLRCWVKANGNEGELDRILTLWRHRVSSEPFTEADLDRILMQFTGRTKSATEIRDDARAKVEETVRKFCAVPE